MNLLCVAICTYNRSEFLENCMQHIIPQIEGKTGISLLIIDNNSTDNTREMVSGYCQKYPFVLYEFCPEQGLSFARNMALQKCNASWLSFLDDDGYANEQWLQENLKIIRSGDFEAFGGQISPWYRDGKKSWFKDKYEKAENFAPQQDVVRLKVSDPYFSGGNCTYHVDKLKQVGGFNVDFGMNGNAMGYGEETAAQRKMAIQGGRLGFSRNMVLYHYIGLNKQHPVWRLKRNYLNGRDFWTIWEKEPNFKNVKHYLFNSLKKAAKVTFSAFKSLIDRKDPYEFSNFLYEVSYWANMIGLLVGILRFKLSKSPVSS